MRNITMAAIIWRNRLRQSTEQQEYVAGTYNIDIYNDGLASGVYFIRLQNKSLQKVINVVKMPL